MNNELMKNEVVKKLLTGIFPNQKNRVWTMCQVALKLCTLAMEEAEKNNLTNEQFYLAWEDAINLLSTKDHANNDNSEFAKQIKDFYADSGN